MRCLLLYRIPVLYCTVERNQRLNNNFHAVSGKLDALTVSHLRYPIPYPVLCCTPLSLKYIQWRFTEYRPGLLHSRWLSNWTIELCQNCCFIRMHRLLRCGVLYCTVLFCTVLNCTVLHCTVLYVIDSGWGTVCMLGYSYHIPTMMIKKNPQIPFPQSLNFRIPQKTIKKKKCVFIFL